MNRLTVVSSAIVLAGLTGATSAADVGLENCLAAFPGSVSENAPRHEGAAAGEPANGNVQLCYRSNDTAFFAMEYDPEALAADWVAYRLEDTFGEPKCEACPGDSCSATSRRRTSMNA
jgi:hypothetical protein